MAINKLTTKPLELIVFDFFEQNFDVGKSIAKKTTIAKFPTDKVFLEHEEGRGPAWKKFNHINIICENAMIFNHF